MKQTDFPAVGRCTCGEIHFTMYRPPMFVHCCHCSWCQRETGSAFAINALIESDQLQITKGTVERIETPSNSGSGQVIVRCPKCEVALWSHYGAAKHKVSFARVGTLGNPNLCPPDIHIYTSTKQAWVMLDDTTPRVDEYYRRSEYWPEQSLTRYQLVIEA